LRDKNIARKRITLLIQINLYLFPSVKAGGMRIVQHKTPNPERPGKDQVEIIGNFFFLCLILLQLEYFPLNMSRIKSKMFTTIFVDFV
jgi:hypothetical protein